MGMRIMGVDAGGSLTRAAVWDLDEETVWQSEAGPGNPYSMGALAAAAEIGRACAEALALAGCHPFELSGVALGIAGNGRLGLPDVFMKEVAAWGLPAQARVTSDLELAARAGLGDRPGVHLIAGTGSALFARSNVGRTFEIGGWGWFLGDPGSGFDIGVRALRWWCRADDGVAEDDGLVVVLQEATGMERPVELLEKLKHPERERPWVGRLALPVIAAAAGGMGSAGALLDASLGELAEAIGAVLLRVDGHSGARVSASGGLLKSETFRDRLLEQIRQRSASVEVDLTPVNPLKGALLMAMEEAGADSSAAVLPELM